MRRAVLAALLVVALPAQAMPVREFLARWEKLSALREMAELDPDAKILTGELTAILKAYRADVEAAAASGKPIACLPPKGEAQFSTDPLIDYLKTLSPIEQEAELKGAIYAFLTQTYPCKSA